MASGSSLSFAHSLISLGGLGMLPTGSVLRKRRLGCAEAVPSRFKAAADACPYRDIEGKAPCNTCSERLLQMRRRLSELRG